MKDLDNPGEEDTPFEMIAELDRIASYLDDHVRGDLSMQVSNDALDDLIEAVTRDDLEEAQELGAAYGVHFARV